MSVDGKIVSDVVAVVCRGLVEGRDPDAGEAERPDVS